MVHDLFSIFLETVCIPVPLRYFKLEYLLMTFDWTGRWIVNFIEIIVKCKRNSLFNDKIIFSNASLGYFNDPFLWLITSLYKQCSPQNLNSNNAYNNNYYCNNNNIYNYNSNNYVTFI